MKKVITCIISVIIAGNAYPLAEADSTKSELALLKEQISLLEQQIKKLEAKYENVEKKTPQVAPRLQIAAKSTNESTAKVAQAMTNVTNKKYWTIPGTSTQMAIEGFFKLTCLKDVNGSTAFAGDASGAGRNFLVARSVGLDGDSTPSRDFYMHARETRFALETISPVDSDTVSTCIEMDFLGDPTGSAVVANNYNLRLRKAYAKFGGFLVGQDWSTFSDLPSFGETVDRNGPVGNCQIRQPVIRYSTKPCCNHSFDFAIENPESEFVTQRGTLVSSGSSVTNSNKGYIDGIKGENRIPDFVVNANYKDNWGYLKVMGLLRENSVRKQADNSRSSKLGLSIGATVFCKLFQHDDIVAQVGYGSGSGRYFMDTMKAATYYDGNKLHNQNAYHVSLGYRHQWQEEYNLRSTLSWGYLRNLSCDALLADIRNGAILRSSANAINKYVMSMHLNFMGNINKSTQAGIEYIIGKRKAEIGLSGILHRIMFAVQVNF